MWPAVENKWIDRLTDFHLGRNAVHVNVIEKFLLFVLFIKAFRAGHLENILTISGNCDNGKINLS